ncbi:MAG TPA: hypothetical protein VIH42_07485 [Thermoguttaceae bacterium]
MERMKAEGGQAPVICQCHLIPNPQQLIDCFADGGFGHEGFAHQHGY